MTATIALSGCASHKDLIEDEEAVVEASVEASSEEQTEEVIEEEPVATPVGEAEDYIFPATTPGEYNSPELLEGDPLTAEELDDLTEFFSSVSNYGFALSSYRTVEDIDWYDVFNCQGAGIHNCEYSKEALYEFMDLKGYDHQTMYVEEGDYYEGLSAISGKDVKAFVEAKTGITDFDFSEIPFYTYIEREDVLFSFRDPYIYENDITCVAGAKKDNQVQVVIEFPKGSSRFDRRLTLEATGDSENPYRFVSNRQLWEKGADKIIAMKDYVTDEIIPCSVNYEENGVYLKPVRDNVVCGFAEALPGNADTREFSYVNDVMLFDIDDDGCKETIALLVYGDELVPIVCMGDHESWGVTYCKEADQSIAKELLENVSELTADNIIAYFEEQIESLAPEGVKNVKAAFEGVKSMPLADTDFCVDYNGQVFGPIMEWSDFTTVLGYPQKYEDNNEGFISAEEGYRWELRYPESQKNPYDFRVVLVSEAMEREGADTYIDFIGLDQTPTYRGVKVGDSVDALKDAYGMPTDIRLYEASENYVSAFYENEAGSLEFVLDSSNNIWTIMIHFAH